MNKNEIWEEIKNDKTMIYGQSMLNVFLQTTIDLKIDHYLELDNKQKKLINNAELALLLAKELYRKTKQRSPELEEIIIKDPEYAYNYARDVIQGRWKEAEPIIMKDPYRAYNYALNIININIKDGDVKIRWKEAEPYIMKDPGYAIFYAIRVIEGRWPEAEETIKKNPYWWNRYKEIFKL
jgi:hypothetical protein